MQAYCTCSGLVTTTVLHLISDVHLLDGLPLEDDPRHIITADRSGTCSLILDSLTAQDSGQYACYAKSSMGSAATLAKVVVQGEYGSYCSATTTKAFTIAASPLLNVSSTNPASSTS